jgi:hypothetical protein
VARGGKAITTPIASGRFDPKTRAFTIQGESEGPDGRKGPFRIDGTVTGDVVRGSTRLRVRTATSRSTG